MSDQRIPISQLSETQTAPDASYIAIDDGSLTKKITVENFNSTSTASAQQYANQAAASAQTVEDNIATSAAQIREATLAAREATQASTAATASATSAYDSASLAQNYSANASTSAGQAMNAADSSAQNLTASKGYAEDSEAWAVGKRNGTDVPSSDDTYQNNAKYYSDNALSSAIRAESAASSINNPDSTLTIEGVAADSKATGDKITKNVKQIHSENDLIYTVSSTNLFNYSDCELGNIKADGTEEDSTTIMRTKNYVPVNGASYIISNFPTRKFFYDETLTFISRSESSTNPVEMPSNTKYIRFLVAKTVHDAHTDIMANAGDTQLPFEEFDLHGEIIDNAIVDTDTIVEIKSDAAELRTDFEALSPSYAYSNNLFNYNDIEPGDISSTGAETVNDNVRKTINPVPISGEYVISNYPCRKIFYNSAGTFILRSSSTSNAVAIPEGAAFVRFSISKSYYEAHTDIMVNVGQTVLPFEPFKKYREIDAESFDSALAANSAYTAHKFYDQLYKVFKRVGVCGDSMSVGYTRNPVTEETLTRNLPYSWVKCVGRDAHTYWLNFGTTGQNVLTWCSSATYGKVQMEAENNKCQAYIIGLGINDVNDIPLGTSSDIVDDPDVVATTYYGGYARIIQLVKRRNADAKIFCFTNPRENSAAKPFNDAVRYIAETYYTTADNVFLVDLYRNYGYLFAAGMPLYIDKQAVSHFSSVGYQMLSKINEEAISKVMLENQLSFLTVPFIPYDTAEPTPNTMTE